MLSSNQKNQKREIEYEELLLISFKEILGRDIERIRLNHVFLIKRLLNEFPQGEVTIIMREGIPQRLKIIEQFKDLNEDSRLSPLSDLWQKKKKKNKESKQ